MSTLRLADPIPAPIFSWRTHGTKDANAIYFAFRHLGRLPLEGDRYQLQSYDTAGNGAWSVVGIYTSQQFEAAVARVIERDDCDVTFALPPTPKPSPKAPRVRIGLQCNECGRKWKVGPNADPQCPKCNGVDYEVL